MERGIRQLKPIIKLDLYPPTNWTDASSGCKQAADPILGCYVKNRLNDSISKCSKKTCSRFTYKRPRKHNGRRKPHCVLLLSDTVHRGRDEVGLD